MLIDLSVPLDENTPIYPGDPKTKIQPAGILAKDGYEDHYISIGTHVGTHMDAPAHMIQNGKSLDKINIDRFTGQGVYVKTGRDITLDKLKGVNIGKDNIVLFHTGMSDSYYKPEYYNNYPAIPENVANYLVDKNVAVVGVDMCSVDHEPFPIHRILLKTRY